VALLVTVMIVDRYIMSVSADLISDPRFIN